MLTDLSLRNFKSWPEVKRLKLAPLTALFGTNSSGKSGLLQSLLMMKQTKESTDRSQVLNLSDPYVNLGTFKDIIYKHEEERKLAFDINWQSADFVNVYDPQRKRNMPLFSTNEVGFSCVIGSFNKGQISPERLSYTLADMNFGLEHKPTDPKAYKLFSKPASSYKFIRVSGRAWDLPAPVKFYGFPDQVRSYFQNAGFLSDLQLEFERQLDRIFYLGPLREYPRREYLWGGSKPVDVGHRGEKAIDALLASRATGEKIGRGRGRRSFSVEEYVAYWLKELGLISDFNVEEIAPESGLYRAKVRKTVDSSEALITDVGFGVSQVLPILVLLYYVPAGSTVLLEQPEIHLHPSVQSGLADVFIDAISVRGIQVIVESHSEHFLNRLRRRVAEDVFGADDAALYFCRTANGHSHIEPLQLDVFGNIANWPENFFGDEFGELAAMQAAALERKLGAKE